MRDEIKRFIRQHVLSWLPQWNLRMQKYANTEGYRGIANLIHASCEDIYEVMDKKIQYGNQSEELKN